MLLYHLPHGMSVKSVAGVTGIKKDPRFIPLFLIIINLQSPVKVFTRIMERGCRNFSFHGIRVQSVFQFIPKVFTGVEVRQDLQLQIWQTIEPILCTCWKWFGLLRASAGRKKKEILQHTKYVSSSRKTVRKKKRTHLVCFHKCQHLMSFTTVLQIYTFEERPATLFLYFFFLFFSQTHNISGVLPVPSDPHLCFHAIQSNLLILSIYIIKCMQIPLTSE